MKGTGYVYFIQVAGGGPIKIGYATNMEKRMGALQCTCPYALEILSTLRGTHAVEAELHERFANVRLRGEWFKPTKELIELGGAARLAKKVNVSRQLMSLWLHGTTPSIALLLKEKVQPRHGNNL